MSVPPAAPFPISVPHVWRGRELAQAQERTVSTGHPALDAELPGGGWPLASLVEVLQERPGQHVWQLALPALVDACRRHAGPVALVAPPWEPFLPALQAQGLPPSRLLCVQADSPSQRLWAAEQALRCGEVAAVLAWLPQVRNEELRRLHLAAQGLDRLLLVFRNLHAAGQSSPARLRLQVAGGERLEVRILKRRGPPLLAPLQLRAQPPRLAALLEARRRRRADVPLVPERGSHVLDRTAALAG